MTTQVAAFVGEIVNAPQVHSGESVIQNLIRHSQAPALLLDCNLLIIQVNPAMEKLLHRPAGWLIGQDMTRILPDQAGPGLAKQLIKAQSNGMSDDVFLARIGTPPVAVRIAKIMSEFGGTFGFLVQPDPDVPSFGDMAEVGALDWEAALHGAGQGVWDYNIRSGLKLYSQTWYDMRGLRKSDGFNEDINAWLDKIHPDDLDLTKSSSADLEAGLLQTVHFEYREKHPQGHWMWIMCRGRPIEWDSAGTPTRYVGTDTDVTAIKSAQAVVSQLTSDEIRWKNAHESTEQGLWDINNQTGEMFLSAQWYHMRGRTEKNAGENDYKSWMLRVHPEDRQRVEDEIQRQDCSSENSTKLEYREWHQDGRWIWILSRGKIVQRDRSGRATRTVGTDTDITDVKISRDRIERISRRLEMALTASHVGVWEFDLSTFQVEWDAVMRAMYGLAPDMSPLPRDIWEIALHPEDRDEAIKISAAAIESRRDYMLDYRIVRPDGAIRHMRSRASHIDDPFDGVKLVGLNWDVTQDYALAQELKDANSIALKNNVQLEIARALMEHNSLHDALTGLPNRRMLDQAQKACFDNPASLDQHFAVLHVDLDRFKQINDTLGHAAGDAALVHIAKILRETVGVNDLVARVGGDEFAVFIENAPSESALHVLAQQIIDKASVPMKYLQHDCRCGVSIGIAFAKGRDIGDDALFINADMAMYRSKFQGRGGFTVFNDDMKREALEKKNLSDQLLAALERDEIYCLYQPQFDCRTLQLTGVEALVRWNNPARGILAPADFLPLAEELQAIDRIDKIVLRLALADLNLWTAKGYHIPRLSINISGRRLRDKCLAQELYDMSLPRGILSFEFLESIFLDEPDEVQKTNISCFRDLGIGIEVDDFGSGHSSIVSLLKLKPDRLKIDRTIVEPVTRSERQRQLVQSIVDIGKLQGIKVLAEGVETAAHVNILQEIGCDELQGYALSRPIDALKIEELLARISA